MVAVQFWSVPAMAVVVFEPAPHPDDKTKSPVTNGVAVPRPVVNRLVFMALLNVCRFCQLLASLKIPPPTASKAVQTKAVMVTKIAVRCLRDFISSSVPVINWSGYRVISTHYLLPGHATSSFLFHLPLFLDTLACLEGCWEERAIAGISCFIGGIFTIFGDWDLGFPTSPVLGKPDASPVWISLTTDSGCPDKKLLNFRSPGVAPSCTFGFFESDLSIDHLHGCS